MPSRKISVYRSDSQASHHAGWCDKVKDACAHDGSQALGKNVEDGLGQADLPRADHCHGHSRVDVASADVPKALHHGGNAESKAEGDKDHVYRQGLLCSTPVDRGAEAEEDKNEHGQKFCRNGFPEGLSPDSFKRHHNSLTLTETSTLTGAAGGRAALGARPPEHRLRVGCGHVPLQSSAGGSRLPGKEKRPGTGRARCAPAARGRPAMGRTQRLLGFFSAIRCIEGEKALVALQPGSLSHLKCLLVPYYNSTGYKIIES